MAMSLKEKIALLKKSSSERSKKAFGSGEFFSYLNPDLMKQHNLNILKLKKSDESYALSVLPYIVGKKDPNKEEGDDTFVLITKVHRISLGDTSKYVICPKAMYPGKGLRCPICEKRQELIEEEDPRNQKIIDELKVKEREVYFVQNFTTRDEAAKGVQIMEISAFFMGWKIKPLTRAQKGAFGLKNARTEDVDISDYNDGKMIIFNITEKKTDSGTMPEFFGHKLEDREPPSDEILEKLAELPPLDELIQVLSEKELEELVNGGISEEPEQEKKDEKPKKEYKQEAKKEEKASSSKDFDIATASLDEMISFAEENGIEIEEDDIENSKKIRFMLKKYLAKNPKKEEKSDKNDFPKVDEIDDIDMFIEHYFRKFSEDKKKDFCDLNGIEYDDEVEDNIEAWYYSQV